MSAGGVGPAELRRDALVSGRARGVGGGQGSRDVAVASGRARVVVVLFALGVSAALVLIAGCDAPPRARAQRIASTSQLIGGPKALGRIGDYLLENDQIRLIIDAAGPGRANSPFGGKLIDADLQRVGAGDGAGNDQLAELMPAFVFEILSPTSVEITADGSAGGAAELRVRGKGGDLLQMVALLNTALLFSPSLELEQIYRLYPGKRYVELETRITNTGAAAHPFPYLSPAELRDLGLDVPGVEDLQLSTPLGQLLLLGGEQELFAPGPAGFGVRFAIEDSYAAARGFPAFPGLVADYVATRGKGVSYGFTIPEDPANYVPALASLYAPQRVTPTSVLLPFTYAGVAAAYAHQPPAALAPGASFSTRAYFIVGRGDAASVYDVVQELRGAPSGHFAGRVVDAATQQPVAGADVLVLDRTGAPVTQAETDARGAFRARLPPGDYRYRVVTDDRDPTDPADLSIRAGAVTSSLVQLPPPATLAVAVLDEEGRHAPVKVTLVGRFGAEHVGADPRAFLYSVALGERKRPTSFDGGDRFIENAWTTADGRLTATVRPGRYQLVVSRGPEYELIDEPIELAAGGLVTRQLRLTRAFATPGWVAGDFHLHAQPSTDSEVPLELRVETCAAEGLEVATSTDHNFVTDYAPAIARTGLLPWLLGISGMELTPFEMGHFNAYPLRVDPGSTRGGEFLWAGKSPQELFDQLRGPLAARPGHTVVQVNHPRQSVLGYFAQFSIDVATGEPFAPSGLSSVFAPYGAEFAPENFSYDFDAIEVITGKMQEAVHTFRAPDPLPPGPFPDPQPVPGEILLGADGRPQFPGVAESWFTLLDRGHTAAAIGTSDTHGTLFEEPGYARTLVFVGEGKDAQGRFDEADVTAAIFARRTVATNAPFVEVTVPGRDGRLARIGDTVRTSGAITVDVRVRSPSWAPVDRVILWSNSARVGEVVVPPERGTDARASFALTCPRDCWIVAEVTGSGSMFPVVPATEFEPLDAQVLFRALAAGIDLGALPITGKLRPDATDVLHPFAMTSPIWLDVDGGGFSPPKAPLPRRSRGGAAQPPDVRAQFEAAPDSARGSR
ncbi:MAG: CehA/McbA family metallohydrolase [Kofleriaceae bacterium]